MYTRVKTVTLFDSLLLTKVLKNLHGTEPAQGVRVNPPQKSVLFFLPSFQKVHIRKDNKVGKTDFRNTFIVLLKTRMSSNSFPFLILTPIPNPQINSLIWPD